jgi:fatty-acyl-CoA synthase
MTDLGPALTLGQTVDRAAARFPDRIAVVFKRERISYADLKRRADDFARGLLALGLGPGDHVVLWMPNRVEWNVANLGIAKIGAVTVTCNSRYKAFELEYVLRQSDARALIMVDRFAAGSVDYLVDPARARAARPVSRAAPRDRAGSRAARRRARLRGRRAVGVREWPRSDAVHVRPEDAVEMLYTSGTTGEPKGCLLSHGNMFHKCRVYTDLHAWTSEDRCLVPVPYFHIFGSMGGVAANCLVGSTQVLMDVFDPLEAMRLIEAERVTIFSGVPTMFITILGHPAFGTRDLRSLRTGSIGAAPVPEEIMRRILDRERGLGMDALVVYGLTEATEGTHWTRPGDPIDRRVSTVGVRTSEILDRVVDPATGRELPPGEEGELCIKGPTLNTYPAEIEDFFLRHPKILDVSIVGVPDPIIGEAR